MTIAYTPVSIDVPVGYTEIIEACKKALTRAAVDKGRKRHADYDNQPIMSQDIAKYSHGWRIDQIQKKTKETERLRRKQAIEELADVIVLAAVEIAVLEAGR